jgi:superfamily I DNA and/or RNA helicase
LNRANVAFSRAQKRLVVICSEELINYIPSEVEYYDSSLLWKTLRRLCSKQIGEYSLDGYNIHLQTIDRDQITD